MAFFSWSRWLRSLWRPRTRPIQKHRTPAARARLQLEPLESRLAPANFIWTGAVNGNWSNGLNWQLGVAPTGLTGTDDLVFGVGATTLLTTNDLPAGRVFDSITISASGYTLKGNALVLGSSTAQGGGATGELNINAGAQNETIALNLTLGGAGSGQQTFTIGQAGSLTVSGTVSSAAGTPGWTKTGTGMMILTGKNANLAEPFTIAQGPVQVSGTTPLGAGATASAVTVDQNAQLQIGHVGTLPNNLTLSGFGFDNNGALVDEDTTQADILTGRVTLDNNVFLGAVGGSELILQGPGGGAPTISDNGSGYAITKVGDGQFVFASANTYRGSTTINDGILTIENPNALGNSATFTNQVTVNTSNTGTGTLQLDDVTPGQAGFVVANELLTINGFGFDGTGALDNLAGNNTWTGNVTLGSNAPTGFQPDIEVDSDVNGVPSNLLISGVIGDPAVLPAGAPFDLEMTGTGRLILTAANTYNGNTLVFGGYLNVEDSQALGPVKGSAITGISWAPAGGGTVTVTTAGPTGFAVGDTVRIDGMVPVLYNGSVTVASVLSATQFTYSFAANPGAATLFGTATENASTDPFFFGTTVFSGAALELQVQGDDLRGLAGITPGVDNMIPNPKPDSITGTADSLVFNQALDLEAGTGIDNTGALHSISGINTWTAPIDLDGAASIGVDADPNESPTSNFLTQDYSLTTSNTITGGDLSKADQGNLILPVANTYTGWTDVQAGSITVEDSQALGAQNPDLPQTLQPYTTVENNAAILLKPYVPGTFMSLPYNFNLAGQGLPLNFVQGADDQVLFHNNALITQEGALENLDGNNIVTGIIQLETVNNLGAGIGVEQVIPLSLDDPIPSQLTLTGTLWDSQPVQAPSFDSAANAGPTGQFPSESGGITKLGSQRLIIQGPGTYKGPDTITSGALLLQNDTGLGAGTFTSGGAPQVTATTVATGASLELGNSVNAQNGGLAGGLSIWGEQLVLNGLGDRAVGAVLITFQGSGYQTAPTATFSAPNVPGGIQATGVAVIRNEEVVGVQITNPGSGYTATPTVTFAGGGFSTAATALVNLPLSDLGPISVITAANPTTGPFNDPIFATDNLWAGPVALATPSNVDVENNGRLVVTGTIADSNVPVSAAAETSSTVTLAANNVFTPGETIVVSGITPSGYDGTFIVTAATPTQVSYTALPGLSTATVSAVAQVAASGTFNLVNSENNFILTGTEAGTTASLTVADTMPFTAGQSVTVNGLSPAAYDGTFVVASVTTSGGTTTITYTDSSGLGTAVVGAGAYVSTGSGELDLYGNNTYSGTTYVEMGVLSIGGNQALGLTGTASQQLVTLNAPITYPNTNYTQFTLQLGSAASDVTAPIDYTGVTATDTQAITTALMALPTIAGAADLGGLVTVTEPTPGEFLIVFGGSLIGFTQPRLIANVSAGGGTVATTLISPGGGGTVVSDNAALQLAGSVTIPGEPLQVTGDGTAATPSLPTQWFPVGPAPIADGQTTGGTAPVTGEVTSVVTDPNDPNIIYIGTAGGGAWKTIDGGKSWHQIFDSIPEIQTITVTTDGTQFQLQFTGPDATGHAVTDTTAPITYSATNPNATAAAIQAALDDPNTMTNIGGVGGLVTVTQTSNGPANNTFTITFQGTLSGQTTQQLTDAITAGAGTVAIQTTELGVSPQFAMYVGAIAMDPTNSNIIYVGTGVANYSANSFYGTGLYKSTDGGATWSQVLDTSTYPGQIFNPFYGKAINAIAIDPNNPTNVYVADADTGFNNSQVVNGLPYQPLEANGIDNVYAGIWRFTPSPGTWFDLTDVVSTTRATEAGKQASAPKTPGPDDDFRITFPYFADPYDGLEDPYADWTDLKIVDTSTINDGGEPPFPTVPNDVPVIYAALGTVFPASYLPDAELDANGVFRCENPQSDSPIWYVGNAGSPEDQIDFVTLTANSGFGTGFNLILPGPLTGTLANGSVAPPANANWTLPTLSFNPAGNVNLSAKLQNELNSLPYITNVPGAFVVVSLVNPSSTQQTYEIEFEGSMELSPQALVAVSATSDINKVAWGVSQEGGGADTEGEFGAEFPSWQNWQNAIAANNLGLADGGIKIDLVSDDVTQITWPFEFNWVDNLVVYASVSNQNGALLGVYTSNNQLGDSDNIPDPQGSNDTGGGGGHTWAKTPGQPAADYMNGQGNYDNAIWAGGSLTGGPYLANQQGQRQHWYNDVLTTITVYVGGNTNSAATLQNQVFTSPDGGTTWNPISVEGGSSPHTSQHSLYVDPAGNLIAGDDGGVFELDGGAWFDINGDLAISQLTGIATNPNSVNSFLAGEWENGTEMFSNSLTWQMVDDTQLAGSTDAGLMGGGQVYIDTQNPQNEYAVQTQLGGVALIRQSTNGGKTWSTIVTTTAATAPMVLDNINPERLLFYGNDSGLGTDLWQTTDASDPAPVFDELFAPINVTAIGLAEYQGPFVLDRSFPDVTDQGANSYDSNTIYVTNGRQVDVTKDDGTRWVNITNGAPFTNIVSLVVDPTNRDTVYALQAAFNGQVRGGTTSQGNIWMYSDATGGKWVEVGQSLGLPNVPVWSLVIDPRNGNIYAGTDIGVYQLPNGMAAVNNLATGQPVPQRWTPFGTGMPNVQVRTLLLNQTTNTLLAGTFGRGAFELFLSADETASYEDTSATTSAPTKAAVSTLSGTPEWTGQIVLAGDPNTNTVIFGAQGNAQVQNPVATVTLNILGAISDAPGQSDPTLIKTGLGNLLLSGPNIYGGATDIQQGAIIADSFTALGGTANGTVVDPRDDNGVPIASGAALVLESSVDAEPLTLKGDGENAFNGHNTGALESISNNNFYFGPITLQTNTTIGVGSQSTLTIVGSITDNGAGNSLTKELTGTLVLDEPATGGNSYSGITYVNQGVLQIASSYALTAKNQIVVLDGAQVQVQSPTAADYPNIVPVMADPNFNLPVTSFATLDLSGTGVNSTGALLDTSSNGLTDFWDGNITLDAQPGFSPYTEPLGLVSIGVTNPLDILSIGINGVLGTGVVSDETTAPTPLALNSGLSIVGSGTVELTQSDTYTGSTIVNAGATLRIQNAQALGGAANQIDPSSGKLGSIQDTIQRLTVLDPSGALALGSFQLNYNGGPWSANLPSDIQPTGGLGPTGSLQNALVALFQQAMPTAGITKGDVAVTQVAVATPQAGSTAPAPALTELVYTIVFQGVLEGMNLSNLITNAVGGATAIVSTVGEGSICVLVQNGGTLALDLSRSGTSTVAGVAAQLNGTGTVSDPIPQPAAGLFAASETSTTVTVTANNTFVVGASVTVAGLDQPGYNGTFIITAANATSFTYTDVSGLTPANPINGAFAVATSTDNGALENVSGNNVWTGPADAIALAANLKGTVQIPPAIWLNSSTSSTVQQDNAIGVDAQTSLTIQADPAGTPAVAGLTNADLEKVGAGTLFFPTVNSYQGNTYVNNGILNISADDPTTTHLSSLGAPAANEVQTITINGSINSFFQLSLVGTFNNPGIDCTQPISSNFTTTSGNASATYTQMVQFLNQLLGVGNTQVTQTSTNVFTIAFTGTLAAVKQHVLSVKITPNNGATTIVAQETVVGGRGATTVNNGGTLQLSGSVDFSPVSADPNNPGEVLTLNGFGFTPLGGSQLGALDSSPTLGGGSDTWDQPIILASNSAIGAEQDPAGNTPALVIDKTISETPTGSGQQLTKLGPGTLEFTGATNNTYTGLTTVANGTLALNKPATNVDIPANLTVIGVPGSAFDSLAQLQQNGQFQPGAVVTVENANGFFDVNNLTTTIGELVTIDGQATTGNGGTLTLNNATALNMTGGFIHTDKGGTVVLDGNALGTSDATGPGIIDSAGVGNGVSTFSLGGQSRTFNVTLGTGTADMSIQMPITGGATTAGIVKTGTGRLQLTADNRATLTAPSVVEGGELQVDGKTNDVQLQGGTISGIGQVGNIAGNSNNPNGLPVGFINPGDNGQANPAGILTSNPGATTETWGSTILGTSLVGTTLLLNLNTPTVTDLNPTAGTDYDQLDVNGNLFLGGTGTGKFNGGAMLSGTVGANVSVGATFTVLQTTGGVISGRFIEPFGEVPDPNTPSQMDGIAFIDGVKFLVQYNPTTVVLTRVLETTTMSLTSSVRNATTLYGQPILFTANVVAENGSGQVPPGDQVQFTVTNSSNQVLATQDVALDGSGNAVFNPQSIKTYGSGTLTVTATFVTDPNFLSPAPQSLTWTVNPDPTTIQMKVNTAKAVYGQPITVTVTVLPTTPGGQTTAAGNPTGPAADVQFTVNGGAPQQASAALDASGTTTYTFTPLALGTFVITASYGGDGNYAASNDNNTPTTVAVGKDNTSVTILANPTSPDLVGQATTFTAVLGTVAPGTAVAPGAATPGVAAPNAESISFTDTGPNGQVVSLGSAPIIYRFDQLLNNGVGAFAYEAQVTNSSLVVGAHTISASYNGDTLMNASTGSIPYVVNTIPSTVGLTTSVNPSILGQQVLFTATVSAAVNLNGAPAVSGVVDFYDGSLTPALLLGAANVNSQGQALFPYSGLAIGMHNVYATYLGGANYAASTPSNVIAQSVLYGDTTTVTSSLNPSSYGQTVTFTATVAFVPGTPGLAGTPQGAVTFMDGNTVLAANVTVGANGTAIFSTASLPSVLALGAHPITAQYTSTNNYVASTGALTENVRSNTTTTLSTSVNPAGLALPVTVTATVTAVLPGTGVPLGTVTFYDGTTIIGTGSVNALTGIATMTTSSTPGAQGYLALGTHQLTAGYGGTPTGYAPSSSTTVNETVIYGDTTTLTSSLNPSPLGGSVIFTATVTPNSNTAVGFNPTGTVNFYDNGTLLNTGGPITLLANGTASFTTSSLNAATHPITAQYSGNVNFITTTSNSVAQSVLNTTTTTITTSGSPTVYSQPFTLTVTVAPTIGGLPTPTGAVTIYDGSLTNPIGAGTLNSGQYAFTPATALAVGLHSDVFAVYTTSSDYTSTSLPTTQQINIASSSITVSSSSAQVGGIPTSAYSEAVTFSAQVAPVFPAQAIPTGTVLFFDNTGSGATQIGTGTINPTNGIATFAPTTPLAVGSHSITATYQGNPLSFQGTSTLSAQPQNVVADNTTTTLTPPASTVYGQPLSFTATVAPVAPGTATPQGTVNFYDDGGTLLVGSATLNAGGVATFTPSAPLPVGSHTITAVYQQTTDFNTSTSGVGNMQISAAGTTTALVLETTPSVFGQAVTFQATVQVVAPGTGVPSGTVDFFDDTGSGPQQIGSAGLNPSGVATYTTLSPLPVGAQNITAQYVATIDYGTSTSSIKQQVVNPSASSITVVSSAALVSGVYQAVYSQPITFTATVAPAGQGTGTPQGTVTFYDGNTALGTATLNGSGQAMFAPTTPLNLGLHSISASYGGSANYQGSPNPSTAIVQQITAEATTVTVSSSINPAVYSQPVTFTAVVAPVAPGTSIPAGAQVTFKDGTLALGVGLVQFNAVNNDYEASFTTSALATSMPKTSPFHVITASFPASIDYTGSVSPALDEVIDTAPTTTTLLSSASFSGGVYTSVTGQAVVLTAVISAAPGTALPLGTVLFYDNGVVLNGGKSVQVNSLTGKATLSDSAFTIGTHTLTAKFTPVSTLNFSASSSSPITESVTPDSVNVNVTSNANPSVFGQEVTFTAAVVPQSPGGGIPTGVVTFYLNGSLTPVGTGTLNSAGTATLSVNVPKSASSPVLLFGSNTIEVQYAGTSLYTAGTGSLTQFAYYGTTTKLAVAQVTPFVGSDVTFTATVAPAAGDPIGSPTPDGSQVYFYDNGNFVGNGLVSNGVATLDTTGLVMGSHTLTAVYQGDNSYYAPSTSNAVKVTVYDAPSQLVVLQPFKKPASNLTAFSVSVQLRDASGAVISTAPGAATIAIQSATATNAAITGTTAVKYVNGKFVFTNLHVTKGGTYTLVISYEGLTTTLSFQLGGRLT